MGQQDKKRCVGLEYDSQTLLLTISSFLLKLPIETLNVGFIEAMPKLSESDAHRAIRRQSHKTASKSCAMPKSRVAGMSVPCGTNPTRAEDLCTEQLFPHLNLRTTALAGADRESVNYRLPSAILVVVVTT